MVIDRNLAASALIVGLALFASDPASAQKYVHQPLDVLSAQAVLSTPAQGRLPYRFGDELFLERQRGLSEKARDRLSKTTFEVRIFRLDDNGNPAPWKVARDDCDIYLTLVFKKRRFTGDRIDLGPLTRFHWLRQNPDGSVEPGRFLIVVEQETQVDKASRLGRWEIFRLQRNTRDQYFKGAVQIEVAPVYGAGRPLPWPDEETQTKQALDGVANEISTAYYCYQAVRIADGDNRLHMASMACGAAGPGQEDAALQSRPTDAVSLWTPTYDMSTPLD